jgi:hypothetical protein
MKYRKVVIYEFDANDDISARETSRRYGLPDVSLPKGMTREVKLQAVYPNKEPRKVIFEEMSPKSV